MITLEETKKKLRETFKVKRKKTFLKNGVIFSEMISSHFINWFANQKNIKNVNLIAELFLQKKSTDNLILSVLNFFLKKLFFI